MSEAWTSYKTGKDIVELKLDHTALSSRGLTTADVTRGVRIAFDGIIVDELQTVDDVVRYRLQFRPQEKGKLETLKNLVVVNDKGKAIPLRSFAEMDTRPGEASIKHYFGQRSITVYADIDRKLVDVEKVNRDLANFIDKENLLHRFPGMRIWFGGELEQQQAALGNIQFAFLICVISILFILMVMAMFWGILFGTLMSLILLPCLDAAEQDLRKLFRKIFVRDRKRG